MAEFLKFLEQFFTRSLFTISGTAVSFTSILIFIGVILVSIFLSRQAQRVVNRLISGKLDATLTYVFEQMVGATTIITGLYIALLFLGIDLGSLVVLVSALGVGIGFGLQNIASNLISGLIILFERPISVGDRVTVGQTIGNVTRIGLRSTEIVTPDSIMIIVPNVEFVSDRVTNWTRGRAETRVHLPIGVAYGTDLEHVKLILINLAQKEENVILTPAPEVWLVSFGDSAINLELLFWVNSPDLIPRLRSKLNFAIEAAFRMEKISMPFPQRDLHIISESSTKPLLGV